MRAAVAGAGIAGLSAALALAQRGWKVDIFERNAAIEEFGAGIQLSPNAMAVLDHLGVVPHLSASLFEPEAVAIYDAPSGAFLNRVPLGEVARRRYGAAYAVIRRSDLQAGLIAVAERQAGITLHFRAEIRAVNDNGRAVEFRAGDDRGVADILVAADGIHSRLRTGYFGHPGPEILGKTAWRATLPASGAPEKTPLGVIGLWLGPGAHLVHYPVRGGEELNLVVIAPDAAKERPVLAPFGQTARKLIEVVPEWRRWPLHRVVIAPPWARGRVVLVGDAAHAMLPSAAQGGAQAVEDAWVLAEALDRQPDRPAEALLKYERSRRVRVQSVADQAKQNLALYEMQGATARFRNMGIRLLPPRAHLARLDWLFGWKPGPKKG